MTFASDPALIREALLGLRDPLSRIALAVSAPAADASQEGVRRRTESVLGALADADARIDELARALAPPAAREASRAECGAVFVETCRRAAVAAAARGVALLVAEPEQRALGDPQAVRAAALRLLRVGCEWAGAAGSLQIALGARGEALVVALTGADGQPAGRGPALRDLVIRFALGARARVHGLATLESPQLTLRLELPS